MLYVRTMLGGRNDRQNQKKISKKNEIKKKCYSAMSRIIVS